MVTWALIGAICHCTIDNSRNETIDQEHQICFRVLVTLERFVVHRHVKTNTDLQGLNLVILLRDSKYETPSMEINSMLENWR